MIFPSTFFDLCTLSVLVHPQEISLSGVLEIQLQVFSHIHWRGLMFLRHHIVETALWAVCMTHGLSLVVWRVEIEEIFV